ncbi:MAG: ATP-binding protein [Bacteroidota bacterium]
MTISNGVSEILFVADDSDQLSFINEKHARLLGYEPNEVIGLSPLHFIPKHQHPYIFRKHMKAKLGIRQHYQFSLIQKSGDLVQAEVNQIPMLQDNTYSGSVYVLLGSGSLEQVKHELKKKDQLIFGASQAISTLFNTEQFTDALTSSIFSLGEHSEADRIGVLFFDEQVTGTGNNQVLWTTQRGKSFITLIKERELLPSLYANLLNQFERYPVLTSQHFEHIDNEIGLTFTDSDAESLLILPLFIKQKLIGVIEVESFLGQQTWTEDEISMLNAYRSALEAEIEKNQTQLMLVEQKQFYENVLNSIPAELVVFNPDHTYRFVNPQAIKNPDIRRWLLGKDDFEYVAYRGKPKKIAEDRRTTFNRVKETKTISSFEEKMLSPEGHEVWKQRFFHPVLDETGELGMVLGFALDITNIKESQREVLNASKRLRTLIQNLNSGILLEDANRRIVVANQEFCDLFEIPVKPDDLIGYDCRSSAEQSKHLVKQPELFAPRISRIVQDRQPVVNEEVVFKNGSIFERDFIPIFNEDQYLGHLWEYRDITHKKQAELDLRRALESERNYNELNRNFVSMVSHEFRTPLTSILSTTEILTDNLHRFTEEEVQKRIHRIHSSSLKIESLVKNVLQLGKLDAQSGLLELEEIVFPSLLKEIMDVSESSHVHNRDVTITSDSSRTSFRSDRNLLELIVRNVLENAAKYSAPDTPIEITYTIDDDSFRFICKDHGIGIPRKEQDLVFESFKRGSNTDQTEGTGLGLPIIQKAIQQLNGTIHIDSAKNKGTQVRIHIPLA